MTVFLRILEYYNGVLFLTTNRPGTLDEAVKSRVHVSLYYKPLGEREIVNIFQMNINRLEETEEILSRSTGEQALYIFKDEILAFAREHYRKYQHGMGRWNGRQIRNAFLIAASIAHNEAEEHPGAQKQLKASHFQVVEDATLDFDHFRAQVLGKADGEIALEREERFDEFQSTIPGRQGYYSPHDPSSSPYAVPHRPDYRRTSMPSYQPQGYRPPPPHSHSHHPPAGRSTSPYNISGGHSRHGPQQHQLHPRSPYTSQAPAHNRAGNTPSSSLSSLAPRPGSAATEDNKYGPSEQGYGRESPYQGQYQRHPYERDTAPPPVPPGADGVLSQYDTSPPTAHAGPEHGYDRPVAQGQDYIQPGSGMESGPRQGY